MTRAQKSDLACYVFDLANRIIKSLGFEISVFKDDSIGVNPTKLAADDPADMDGALLAGRSTAIVMARIAFGWVADFCIPIEEQPAAREVLKEMELIQKK